MVEQKSSARFSTATMAHLEAIAGDDPDTFREVVKTVRSAWKHMVGSELDAALKDFGAALRASANLIVSWVGQITIINDTIDDLEERLFGRERERKRNMWRDWRKKLGLAKT